MKIGKPGAGKLNGGKLFAALFLLCAVAATASSAQTFTTLANFNKPNGSYPAGPLEQGFDGNFYGATQDSAVFPQGGTVFAMTPAGAITTVHNFSVSDGGYPTALVLNNDGSFFGIACCNDGTAFTLGSKGKFKVLFSFDSIAASPNSALLAANGEYYGTTLNGGSADSGMVFEMTPVGALTTLYNFCSLPNCADSGDPVSLIQASDGNFYGTGFGEVLP